MKRCTGCGQEKKLEEFHRRRASKDGREHSCKACRHSYYLANRERMNAQSTAWRKENPERWREIHTKARKKLEKAGYFKAWRDANREKWREYSRRNDKPEKQAARRARFRVNNPGYTERYREQRDLIIENFTDADLALRQTGRCGICGTDLYEPIEIDHIVPVSRGGHHTFDNCQLAHRSCNRQKHNRPPEECGAILPKAA